LKAKLDRVLGLDGDVKAASTADSVELNETASAPRQRSAAPPKWDSDEEDDGMSFFEKLAAED